MVDQMFNPLTPEAFTPRGILRLSFEMMQQSAAAVRLVAPWPEARRALQEFQNKLEAYNLFAHVDSVLQIAPSDEVSLPELIKKTETLEPYRAVWATEGLGYYLATAIWKEGQGTQNLLNNRRDELPATSLAALHAGMGLAIANRLLEKSSSGSDESEIRARLDQFVRVCRDNSRPGYVGATYESLGLVARTLYPQMITSLDRQLRQISEDLRACFWHGVGRGIYFVPTNFLPDGNSSRRAVKMTREEPPDESAKTNALAGLVWAMTLVNIRHPEILESLLQHQPSHLDSRDAFVNGVSSSVIIWRDSTRDDTHLKEFCRYQPTSDEALEARWEEMVRRPALNALEYVYPVLKREGRLGDVFHYQDLSEMVQRMS